MGGFGAGWMTKNQDAFERDRIRDGIVDAGEAVHIFIWGKATAAESFRGGRGGAPWVREPLLQRPSSLQVTVNGSRFLQLMIVTTRCDFIATIEMTVSILADYGRE